MRPRPLLVDWPPAVLLRLAVLYLPCYGLVSFVIMAVAHRLGLPALLATLPAVLLAGRVADRWTDHFVPKET